MLIVGAVALAVVADRLRDGAGGAARAQSPLVGGILCAAVIGAAMVRSIQRTTVWRENDRLFRQAVTRFPVRLSRAPSCWARGTFEQKRKREGEAEYRKALALFPYDPFLSYDLAEQYRSVGMCEPAIPLYRWSHGLDPKFPLGRGALAWCLLNEGPVPGGQSRRPWSRSVGAAT